jgi:hypothetical protein
MAAGQSARAMAGSLRAQAARLTAEAANWESGADGEERVAQALAAADAQSTRVLHDRLIAAGRSEANIDHLVVSITGIYLIDTKNWVGSTTFYNESIWQHWTGPEGRQSVNKKVELDKVRGMAERAGNQARCPGRPGAVFGRRGRREDRRSARDPRRLRGSDPAFAGLAAGPAGTDDAGCGRDQGG